MPEASLAYQQTVQNCHDKVLEMHLLCMHVSITECLLHFYVCVSTVGLHFYVWLECVCSRNFEEQNNE